MKKTILLFVIATVILVAVLSGCLQPPVCGNGTCEIGENTQNCPADCGQPPQPTHLECKNNTCTTVQGAGQNQCQSDSDCLATGCGNGTCDSGETFENCDEDCQPNSFDTIGNISIGTTKQIFSAGEQIELKPPSILNVAGISAKDNYAAATIKTQSSRVFSYLKDGRNILFSVPETNEKEIYQLIDSGGGPVVVSSSGKTFYPSSLEISPGKKRYIVMLKQKGLVELAVDTLGRQKILISPSSDELKNFLQQLKPQIEQIQNNAINSIKDILGKKTAM